MCENQNLKGFKIIWGWMQCLMPVIPALSEAEEGGSLESGVRDQPGQHGEMLSLLNMQKLAMPVVPATREAEAGESLEAMRWRLQ